MDHLDADPAASRAADQPAGDPSAQAVSARPAVLRVRSVPDLLALVPVTLGFEPRESLVAIGVGGAHPGFQARVDLPASLALRPVAQLLADAMRSQGCSRAAVVAFSGHPARSSAALRATAERLAAAGVGVLDLLRADRGRYWSLSCSDLRCCPPEGTAYDPASTALRAEATLAGKVVLADRESLERRYAAVSGAARRRSLDALPAAEAEVVEALALRRPADLRRARAVSRSVLRRAAPQVDALLGRLLAGDPVGVVATLSDTDAARLAVWASVTGTRDLAWTWMSRAQAPRHVALWTGVAQRVVPPYEPGVLALAGFAAWLSGDGASAWCLVDRCLEVDPAYSMAVLLADTLDRCVPPSAWEPPPRQVVLGG